mmetsp:Transcript_16099/g.37317  ORF Transcript_16099/g.37317 Transcript_16099/m.37317 type:complete len:291 (-) Transcript_16099:407-1279(-)
MASQPPPTRSSGRSVGVAAKAAAAAALACYCLGSKPIASADAFAIVGPVRDARGPRGRRADPGAFSRRSAEPTALFAALPEGYQEFANAAIRKAARLCGMDLGDDDDDDDAYRANRLDIAWKAGSIIVTVHGEVSLAAGGGGGASEDDDDDDDDEEDPFDENPFPPAFDESDAPEEFSLTLLARTINRVLDDEGTGLAIAEVHSIEVTTPGVSDELVPGTPQFDAFKGFEVLVEQLDPKKKKTKIVEGRLVERDDEFTVVNIKGRMKKMKNETVLSIRLPKAKKEKGGGR